MHPYLMLSRRLELSSLKKIPLLFPFLFFSPFLNGTPPPYFQDASAQYLFIRFDAHLQRQRLNSFAFPLPRVLNTSSIGCRSVYVLGADGLLSFRFSFPVFLPPRPSGILSEMAPFSKIARLCPRAGDCRAVARVSPFHFSFGC